MNLPAYLRRFATPWSVGWILFWLLMISVSVQDYVRNGGMHLWEPLLWEGSAAFVVTLLVLVQRRFGRRADGFLHKPKQWFLSQLIWLPGLCAAFVPLTYGIRHAVYALIGSTYLHDSWMRVAVYETIKISLFFCSFTAILFGILSYRALAAEKQRAEQSAALLRQTQLQQLAQQIQPHFLFNALNTVSSLLHTDSARADSMLARLSGMLRRALSLHDRPDVDLREELAFLRDYAELMLERFSDRASIAWEIDEAALACRVPAMSLQPLLENVFKHTVERFNRPVAIRVSVRRDQDMLTIRIDDDAGLLPAAHEDGIGLKNVRQRLAALHGNRMRLDLVQLEPAGVRVEMRLPCVS